MVDVAELRVLLIDAENVGTATATARRRRSLLARVEALLTAAGPVHHAVAAYAVKADQVDPLASELAAMRISPLRAVPAPNAAEDVLLAHARHVHTTLGCRRWVVASGDKRFTALAELGVLEVLAWQDQKVAERLLDVAHAVHRVPRPDRVDPVTVPDEELVGGAPVEVEAQPAVWRRVFDGHTRTGARSAAAVVLAGVGFGVGQRLVDVLLPRSRRVGDHGRGTEP